MATCYDLFIKCFFFFFLFTDLVELRKLLHNLKRNLEYVNVKLIKAVKQRTHQMNAQEAKCNIVTALLQAISEKKCNIITFFAYIIFCFRLSNLL